jgi:hypothetical protein
MSARLFTARFAQAAEHAEKNAFSIAAERTAMENHPQLMLQ